MVATTKPDTTSSEAAHSLETELAWRISGEVRFDQYSRMLYSTDASNYQIEPIGVVLPRTIDDVRATDRTGREVQRPDLATRRRQQPGRTDRRPSAGDRHLEVPEPDSRGRHGLPYRARTARHRAAATQHKIAAPQSDVRARPGQRRPRHHRRRGREQRLRLPLDPLWHDRRPRHCSQHAPLGWHRDRVPPVERRRTGTSRAAADTREGKLYRDLRDSARALRAT